MIPIEPIRRREHARVEPPSPSEQVRRARRRPGDEGEEPSERPPEREPGEHEDEGDGVHVDVRA